MADFSIGDEVIVYSQEQGIRKGTLAALPDPEAHMPLYSVRLGDVLWIGPDVFLFAPDTPEESIEEVVSDRLGQLAREFAARRAEREAQLEAQLAEEEGEEGDEGAAT